MNIATHTAKLKKKPLVISLVVILILIAAALLIWFKWPYQEYEGLGMRPDWDVADNIVSAPGNQIFAGVVYNLEYTTFLHGTGPFTVFVPTDESYKNLPPETKAYLNNIQNQWAIRQVMLYHVVKGRYLYSDFKDGMQLETVQGEKLAFVKKNDYWEINGYAHIQTPDILSKNGVIHVTDNYLLPPSLIGAQ
jgi:uncharacterized surface protein with fasciclin (FAS1) repeats